MTNTGAPAGQDDLQTLLNGQRAAVMADGPPSSETRRDRIQRLIDLVLLNANELTAAMNADFTTRSAMQSLAADVLGILPGMKADMVNVARWMRPKRTSSGPLGLLGARSRIEYVPRGVVGIVSPWNFPLALALAPLSQAFAAGNRAMIKMSESTPHTSALVSRLISDSFAPEEAVVVIGDADVGAAFAALPFDLLFFTGATAVGRHVMRACAENLVPCVLELGGKSPVLISANADLEMAAKRIAAGKLMNAGQMCVAPDHVFLPEGSREAFTEAYRKAVSGMFNTLRDNPDYTAIINQGHWRRLRGYVDEARAAGAEIVEINPAGEDLSDSATQKLPPMLVFGANNDLRMMREEIFGPILPVVLYHQVDEVIAKVNAGDRPLALYYFGPGGRELRAFLDKTCSGGVSINDVVAHVANEHLPFGGVGASGMGAYHGRAGFETFSHARAVMKGGWISPIAMFAPPYGERTRKMISWQLKREQAAAARRLAARG